MSSSQAAFPDCDTQALHKINSIQSFGALLIINPYNGLIEHASLNCKGILGRGTEYFLGSSYREALPTALVRAINDLGLDGYRLLTNLEGLERLLITAQLRDTGIMLEFESLTEHADKHPNHLHQMALANLLDCKDEARLVEKTVQIINDRFQFGRCMIYRFEPDHSGVVIAEDHRGYPSSYLNLRFPAGDIPANARQLYLKNPLRIIQDIQRSPVEVFSTPEASTLDLTYSVLRAVAPVHIQYLKHMEVRASLSVPIIVNQDLWGLISCHHDAPLSFNGFQRQQIIDLAQAMTNKLRSLKAEESMRYIEYKTNHLDRLTKHIWQHRDSKVSEAIAAELLQRLEADGLAIHYGNQWQCFGLHPEVSRLEDFLAFVPRVRSSCGVLQTDCCSAKFPKLEDLIEKGSGLLAIWAGKSRYQLSLLFFRQEFKRMVNWGGMPPSVEDKHLGPRTSFALWRTMMEKHSKPWSREQEFTGQAIAHQLLSYCE